MSKAADKLCAVALKEVGADSGAKYNIWYWGYNTGAAWCAAFASWCLYQAGFGAIGGKYASCTTWRDSFLKPKGIWFDKGRTDPRPGDLVFYNWDGGTAVCHHVGIVISYDAAKKQLTTVEGNTNGQCRMMYRALTYVVGYGRPPYPEVMVPAPVTPPSTYTVVRGDTLSGIAKKHGMTLAALLKLNPQIKNPNIIHVGEKISVTSGGQDPGVYTVARGDTMSGIAAKHKLTLAALAAANPQIKNINVINVGQKINIPGKG